MTPLTNTQARVKNPGRLRTSKTITITPAERYCIYNMLAKLAPEVRTTVERDLIHKVM